MACCTMWLLTPSRISRFSFSRASIAPTRPPPGGPCPGRGELAAILIRGDPVTRATCSCSRADRWAETSAGEFIITEAPREAGRGGRSFAKEGCLLCCWIGISPEGCLEPEGDGPPGCFRPCAYIGVTRLVVARCWTNCSGVMD